jgi:diguanylate cyclase (GGDEF)-like protein
VDDDESMRKILSYILVSAGFRVQIAADGAEALRAVRRECPYFVITDWIMSPIDGIQLCQELRRQKLPHYVYVVFLTARSQSEDITVALNAGADDFATKPIDKEELLARLEVGANVLELDCRLKQLARCDMLTGLLHRRTFQQILEKEWSRAIRYCHPLSCVMLDLEHFQSVNDRFGERAGDAVLRDAAQTIKDGCRCPDHICRWGGDRFCVLLPETDERGAIAWAERCCAALAESKFRAGTDTLAITANFAVVQQTIDVRDPDHLLALCEQALLVTKKARRERMVTI